MGPSPEMTIALCGVPSLFTKFITTLALAGTTSVPPPFRKPLKVNGPAISSNVTVFVAASYESHFSWPVAGAGAGVALAESAAGAEGESVGFGAVLVRDALARALGAVEAFTGAASAALVSGIAMEGLVSDVVVAAVWGVATDAAVSIGGD
jgi:hypothetical protein